MFKNSFKKILIFSSALSLPKIALALNINQYTKKIAETSGFKEGASLEVFLGRTISYALGLVGAIFFTLIIISGFQMLTAGAEEEKIKKAKARIINSTIGIAIITTAYIITNFVYSAISQFFLYG
jgi:hypothetical protein